MNPQISVIVPIYNVEKYIHKCIDSILSQTFTDFELILVDDGSPDKCGEICEQYAIKDDRIKVIHKENGGLSDARNVGVQYVNGGYTIFVDSDDWIESTMIEEMVKLIDEYNAQEKAINDKIDGFRDELPEITNVDEALDDIAEMKIMIKDNEDDVAKCDRLRMNISLYKKFIDEIYVDVIKNSKELILIQLKHDEKVIKTKSLPQIGSQCARDFSRKHNGNIIEITFNSFDCYEQDNNYIEVRFSFGDKKIKKRNITRNRRIKKR